MDPETASNDSFSMWDDESGITWMRKYHALKEEAQDTVVDSKRVWEDTPFSLYALQCKFYIWAWVTAILTDHDKILLAFVSPRQPAGMQATFPTALARQFQSSSSRTLSHTIMNTILPFTFSRVVHSRLIAQGGQPGM